MRECRKGFSIDLRESVLRTVIEGSSTRQTVARFGVGISTAGHRFRRYRDHGETVARGQGQPKGSKLDANKGFPWLGR